MDRQETAGLRVTQNAQGVWERKTAERRLGQNQLFGSFRIDSGANRVNQSDPTDPTDTTLAAIASILQHPEAPPKTEPAEAKAAAPADAVSIEIDGYSKSGPGPLDSLRFKWTMRRDGSGAHFVDETIGNSSRPITSGPMSQQAAIEFIDDREREAHKRYETLRRQMTSTHVPQTVEDRSADHVPSGPINLA